MKVVLMKVVLMKVAFATPHLENQMSSILDRNVQGGNMRQCPELRGLFRDAVLFPQISEQARALVCSQGGPIAGRALAATPSCHLTRIGSHLFRVVLLRRLHPTSPLVCAQLPVWPSPRRPWPPPCRLCEGRGVGAKGLHC